MLQNLKNQIQQILGSDFDITHKIPKDQKAWLAVPVFAVAKKRGESLGELAGEVAAKLQEVQDIKVEIAGGYVNIIPTSNFIKKILAEEFTLAKESKGNIVIEFSSPNIAKPMSIGHLRSTIIGDSLQRIYRALGYKVTSINYLGDWGTQFGKLLVAYKRKFGDLESRNLQVADLLALYVDFHKDATDEDEQEARDMFALLEAGDKKAKALWQQLKDTSLQEFNKVYKELGVEFDEIQGEFQASELSGQIIDLAKEKGIAKESEGALIISLHGTDTPLLLQKQDGSTIYGTRDLAAIKFRIDNYNPEKILYVVGAEQSLHLLQVFEAAELLGFGNRDNFAHVKFGLIRLPEGKISTRAGRVILLEDVIAEAKERAEKVVDERSGDLTDKEKLDLVDAMAIGGLKFFDLHHGRQSDIVFSWDEMLSLKGKSAPYLQYSYVRAKSVLAKAGESEGNFDVIPDGEDKSLLKLLSQLGFVLEESAEQNAPHILANYLVEVAEGFHSFYEQYKILTDDKNAKLYRLQVTKLVASTIKQGLDLLGIRVVEKM